MKGLWNTGPVVDQANAAITGGTIAGTNAAQNLFSTGIPFINVSTGSMGNNGALTAITALDTTYSDGCYMLFPAGAIASGVPAAAAWYWVVMSSTTAGTVFNNTYTSGQPTVPASNTAFVTTGPGAFTGVTGAMDTIVFSVPANSMGPNGTLRYEFQGDANSNANGKNISTLFGATTFNTYALASNLSGRFGGAIQNRGVTNRQVGNNINATGGWGVSNAVQTNRGSNDTTTALNFKLQTNKATATDNLILACAFLDVTFR